MYFVGVAATVVTLLGALGFWQWNRTRRQAIDETVAKLQSFIDTQDYAAAEGVVKQLSADGSAVAKSPEVIAIVEDLKSKQTAENERRQRTEALIASAERDDPSTIDINQVMLAEKEARTPEEIIRIKRVRTNWESYERSLSEVHASSIKKSVTNLDSKLLAIEQLPLDEINDAEIDAIVIDLNKLPSEFPKALNKDTLLKPALDRATAIKENARKRRSEIALRQRLTVGIRSAASLSAFASELKDYADKLPGDKLARQFSDALLERALWQQLEDWNQWCDNVTSSATNGFSAEEWANLSSKLNALKKKLAGLPGGNLGEDLEQLAGEANARKTVLTSLTEQFSVGSTTDSANQLAQLVTLLEPGKNGKRRFMNFQARIANAVAISKLGDYSKISLPVIVDEALQSEEVDFKGKVVIYDEPRATIRRLGEHFQQKDFLENWDMQMIAALRIILEDKNLDGMLKEFLLEAVIKAAGDGSKFMKDALAPTLKKLGDTREERSLWYVPAAPNFQLNPEVAASLKQGVQQARTAQSAFMGRLGQTTKVRFIWVGAILRDNSDKLEAWLSKADTADGQLFSIIPTPNSRDAGQLTKIGLIENKRVTLNAPPERLFVGRPLFWLPNPKPATAGASAPASVK